MKVLVIGHLVNSDSVDSWLWNEIPENANPSEYDAVILDYSEAKRAIDDDNIRIELPNIVSFFDLLSCKKPLYFLGDPGNTAFQIGPGMHGTGRTMRSLGPFCFFPARPETQEQSSNHSEVLDGRFEDYFELADGFHFYFTETGVELLNQPVDAYFHASPTSYRLSCHPIARNKADRFLAVHFDIEYFVDHKRHTMFSNTTRMKRPTSLGKFGPVVWLPPLPEEKRRDGILSILDSVFNIHEADGLPEWVNEYPTGTESKAYKEVALLQDQIDSITQQQDALKEQIDSEQKWKMLLYTTGEELENIVFKALEYLEIDYSKPTKKGVEDGHIHDSKFGDWTLEIKGRSGQIKLSDIRQLKQWSEENEAPGLLIENSFCNDTPMDRTDPLASNAKILADNTGITMISTFTLFQAVCKKQSGEGYCDFLQNALA